MLTKTILRLTLFISSLLVATLTMLHLYRVEITTAALEKLLHADVVTIERMEGFFPFTIEAEGIRGAKGDKDILIAHKIEFEINPLALLLGTLELNYVRTEKLEITLETSGQSKGASSLPLALQINNAAIEARINGTPVRIDGSLGNLTDATFDVKEGTYTGSIKNEGSDFTLTLTSHPFTATADLSFLKSIPFTATYGAHILKGRFQSHDHNVYHLTLLNEAETVKALLTWEAEVLMLKSFGGDVGSTTIQLEKEVPLNLSHGLSLDQATFLIGQEKLSIKDLSLGDTLKGTATLDVKTLHLLEKLIPSLTEHKLQGTANAQARLLGTFDKPQMEVKITGQNIKSERIPLKAPLSIKATLQGDIFTPALQASLEAGPDFSIQSTGKVNLEIIDLTHKVHASLTPLKAILPSGDRVDGKITGEVKTTGALTSPQTTGRLQVQDGLYQNQIIGLHIHHLQGSIDLKQSDVTASLEGHDDFKGILKITGAGNLIKQAGELKAHFTQFYLGQSDLFTAKADGDVTLDMAKKTIHGELLLDPVVVDIDQLTPTSTPKLQPIAQHKENQKKANQIEKEPTKPSPFFFDIRLKPRKYVVVRGFGIESTWLGEMKLHGHTPDFVGTFNLNKGTIDITGRVLNFTHGKITFDHHIDEPYLDLEITKKIDAYEVFVQLQGRPKSPKFTFLSSPALSQEEVLALIMLGRRSAAASLGQLFEVSSSLESLSSHGQSDTIFTKFRRVFGIEALEIKKQDQSSPSESPQALSIRKSISPDVAVVIEQLLSSTDEETKSSKATIEASLTENLNLEVDATTNKSGAVGFSWIKRY